MNGEQLRDEALDRAGSGQPVVPLILWEHSARFAILQLCLADCAFSAEDVRKAAGNPPTPGCMGAAFRSAYRAGLIRPDSVGMATRPERHASLIRYWRRK